MPKRSVSIWGLLSDPWTIDERCLMINVEGRRLVVLTACSRAGVISELNHVHECYPVIPIHAVKGGFHLVGRNESIIPETVKAT
jgi:7,8-dihydropterin-6-yl-methyl-4-(beta-D-ribofuranosyl)aminobenzene 5'-phosphate synthase